MELPESLIIQYFYEYSGYPEFIKSNNVYNACCPICREGKSWGKKKRLFFIPEKQKLYCHNCQRSWNPLSWICEVSGKNFFEITEEANSYDYIPMAMLKKHDTKTKNTDNNIPFGSISLSNQLELEYHKDNKVIQDALAFISKRRLDTALNHVGLFISLRDFVFKDRICIPFRELNNKVIFFQCRALYKDDEEGGRKYISKINSDISVFNIEKIDIDFPYIFQFEGPIDSMFVKNGVGMAGLAYTELQKKQLSRFITHKKIWVLDNQNIDEAAKKKSFELVKRGESVFVWPKKFTNHKDLNDICVANGLDSINPNLFIQKCVNTETELISQLI